MNPPEFITLPMSLVAEAVRPDGCPLIGQIYWLGPGGQGSWIGVPEAVKEPAPARKSVPAPKIESPYLDLTQAAEYCRVAKKTLYNHRSRIERMPGTGKLVFRREALDKWLSSRKKRK